MKHIEKLNQLAESHGELRPGHGMVSGVIALALAMLCFPGVLAFHFPQYLSTPQLRKSYDVAVLRTGWPDYAAHFAFLDHRFGTAVRSSRDWPQHYGVQGHDVPDGFFKQLVFPFRWKG